MGLTQVHCTATRHPPAVPREALPEGIEFTHVAFAVYSSIELADGRKVPGHATYNLYQSDDRPNTSSLKQDYPFNSQFQNCTEFVLDVVNAAVYQTSDRQEIKMNEEAYFQPESVRIDGLTLLFATLFKPDITTSDHEGSVRTATFDSMARYMESQSLADEVFVVRE